MFEKYSEQARFALYQARLAAARLHSPILESDHILLGVLSEMDPLILATFEYFQINPQDVILEVETQAPSYPKLSHKRDVPLSEDAKQILAYALQEAENLRFEWVGLEHFLLGIMRVDCSARDALRRHGFDLFKLREFILTFYEEEEQEQEKVVPKEYFLKEYCVDYTKIASQGGFDPLVGREQELQRIIQILSRRLKNNPLLVGEAGVGKTALVEGLAQAVAQKKVPPSLKERRILALDIARVVAGTKYRGQFEERLKGIVREAKNHPEVVLYLDEMHTLVGAGSAEGTLDAANILKPSLSRGEITCIGATTLRDFRRFIEKDKALMRRFQPVMVKEPSEEETFQILMGVKSHYETFHHVEYPQETLKTLVMGAQRYIHDRPFPDKALDIMDEAGALVHLENQKDQWELEELKEKQAFLHQALKKAVQERRFDEALRLQEQEEDIRHMLRIILKAQNEKGASPQVTPEHVWKVIASWSGVPLEALTTSDRERLKKLEETLKERIVGQEEAIHIVAQAIRRKVLGLAHPNRPMGVFFFLGPSGVGKTEVARQLARCVFASPQSFLRFDMSEYMEKHTASRLLGAPPGYIGYEEGGQLTEKVRRNPYAVLLLDEFEKAHPDVHLLLLQVMEDGRLTDSLGNTVDFRHTIIILTGNVGSHYYQDQGMGFTSSLKPVDRAILKELEKKFPPEFLNRLDNIVLFHPLSPSQLEKVAQILLDEFCQQLKEQKIHLTFDPTLPRYLVKSASSTSQGARPIRHALDQQVTNRLSNYLLNHPKVPPRHLHIQLTQKGLRILENENSS